MNEITKFNHPDVYWTEAIFHELIQKEFIPDILVELTDESYYPIGSTKFIQTHRLKYHLIEETLFEMCHAIVSKVIEESVHK